MCCSQFTTVPKSLHIHNIETIVMTVRIDLIESSKVLLGVYNLVDVQHVATAAN